MLGVRDFLYMTRDFFYLTIGRDYFHQPQRLGWYFLDERCYYNDLTGKANWNGKYLERVPALYVPTQKTYIILPVMVLQYGLGSVDRFFLSGEAWYLSNITNVTAWLLRNIRPEGYFDNHSSDLENMVQHYSNNSAMAQGQALSFLIRVKKYRLIEDRLNQRVELCIKRIFANLIGSIEDRGTVLRNNDGLYFCEFCRKDRHVVLNGWIYAVFGLFDYCGFSHDNSAKDYLTATLITLKSDLASFILPSGWSYYDNKGRLCSPFYQALHIHLLDAMYRLTGDPEFGDTCGKLKRAYTPINRARFTISKIKDRLTDSGVYTTGTMWRNQAL